MFPTLIAVPAVIGANVRIPPEADNVVTAKPSSERKDGLLSAAANVVLVPMIFPRPACKTRLGARKLTVTLTPPLLSKFKSSLALEVSESDVILPDKLIVSISVVSLAAPP